MSTSDREHLPEDLEALAARLRANRAEADPLQLDQIKLRAMARVSDQPWRFRLLKSRLATLFTILGLVGGTGGAVALAGSGSNSNGKGAANGQYCHQQTGDPDCNGDANSNNHTGSKGRGAGGDDKSGSGG